MNDAEKVHYLRFLRNPTADNLALALWWENTPQGYAYWLSVWNTLKTGGSVPKEAMKYIYERVGQSFPDTLEQAEWE